MKNQESSREISITNSTRYYNPEEIIEKVCAINQIEKKRLMSNVRGNIYRPLTLYLIKKLSPLKLAEIGELFDMNYSTH